MNRGTASAEQSVIELDEIWDSLPADARSRLERFGELVMQYKDSARLTSLSTLDEALAVLVRESLALTPLVEALSPAEVVDLGSGAGVPGVPLAVLFPRTSFVVLERSERKAGFLQIAVNTLGLANVQVSMLDPLRQRTPQQRACVVTRAAFPPSRIPAVASKLLLPGGHLMGFVAPAARDALAGAVPAWLKVRRVLPYRCKRGVSYVYWLAREEAR
ncbi:MAG: hypothetical protein A2Y63_04735 [Candidatus Riflebacteria bacterium RBG_13_59_9]|nr:MAG: hypothetical protein A2Y63_04735 [Candidatus Riflebacteria bacterium RBG_13_59_9]